MPAYLVGCWLDRMPIDATAGRAPYRQGDGSDVVAVLADDGHAPETARLAVAEARHRGGRVRFVQALPDGADADELARVDRLTFRAGIRAMESEPGIACTFQSVSDPMTMPVGGGPDWVREAAVVVLSDVALADRLHLRPGCRVVVATAT